MKKLLIILAIAFVLIGIPIMMAIGTYNGLVGREQAVDAAWAQVENVYQRRADLVPNLVATVSGAADFEKSTLTEVTNARASVGKLQLPPGAPDDAARFAQFEQAQSQLGGALSRLLVSVERYPQLTATANFRDLQAQLEGTENRISVERGKFNTTVQSYNTAIKKFPAVILAGLFGHEAKPYFTAAPGSNEAPKVDFGG
ncbi:LemA family protein [Synoicihabitans lomoniglobus]|uniref:LemA family protein n=1 Tax=Synoicihabitans lomoniglobus TaxID=2909285 RepID=A0AAF0A0S7_9BACT|nr:LemA family protein [Opitutaceae bacterium LMO-M01]WED64447.1 LemA family protein [Opitutaceae bacterium LMO-M01]